MSPSPSPIEPNKNVEPFNQDVVFNQGYIYTTNTRLSSKLATQRTTDIILELAHFQNRNVLDAGCGDGFYTFRFWDAAKPKSMVGVDLASEAIDLARRNRGTRPIEFEVGDAHHLPYKDNAFDTVLIQSILHHDDAPLDIIREGFRLAPEVVIHEPNGNNFGLKIIEQSSPYHRAHHEQSYSFRQMKRWVEQAGGEVTAYKFAGFVPMFCPDLVAKMMKRVEFIVEGIPAMAYWAGAVYALTATRVKTR